MNKNRTPDLWNRERWNGSFRTEDGNFNFHPLACLTTVLMFIGLPMGNVCYGFMSFSMSLWLFTWFIFVPLLWLFTGWRFWDPEPLRNAWDAIDYQNQS